jgi:phospholipid/cholesterol/gamma-HCH transport system substrate-binding protein
VSIKNFRERSPFLVGIISLVALAAATTFAFFINRIPALKQAYDVKAEFADAAGLTPENQVRVAGVKVGTVKEVALQGDRVLVTMEIENSVQIPDDADAEIKLATILGTKFVDVKSTGGGPFLEDGDTIPLARTQIPYEIYQASNQGTAVLEDLDGEAFKDMLVELTTLVDTTKEEIGVALEGLNELGTGLNAKRGELRALLRGADDLTALLSDEGDELVRLIDSSNTVLGSLASKREELQSLLDSTQFMARELTSLIRENRGNIDASLVKLHQALRVLERNVENLDVAFEYAGPSTRYFGSVFSQGRWGDIFSCALIATLTCETDE